MSVVPVKAALTQPHFPMNSDNFVDCVLRDAGFEQERLVEGFDNQPQAFFMQNVLPQARGFTSVHYSQVVTESTYPVYMDKVLQLRDATGSVALLAPAGGKNLIYSADTGAWVSHDFGFPHTGQVTIAYLKGVTYVCYEGLGLYVYDFNTQTFDAVTVAGGIVFANVLGVAAAGVYLLLYTNQYIAYSSPLDPLDFNVPPVGTGGQSAILANRGVITVVFPVSNGIIVHTTVNAIRGQLTGNANFPFSFQEIPNSSGVSDSEHVTYDDTNDAQIAWTSSGLMEVSLQKANPIWEELSDLLANNKYPAAGPSNLGYFPAMQSKAELAVKVSAIGARYIVVSVKDSSVVEFPVAYVYDLGLKRWGRLDIPHIDVFEYRAPEFTRDLLYDELAGVYDYYTETYNALGVTIQGQAARFGTTFGLVGKLGAVYMALQSDYPDVEFLESSSGAATPLILLGKYKLIRKQAIIFQWAQVGLLHSATVTAVGHNAEGNAVKTKDLSESVRDGTYNGRLNAAAISLSIRGRFSLTSLSFGLEPVGSGLPVVATADNSIPLDVVTVDGDYVVVGSEYVVL